MKGLVLPPKEKYTANGHDLHFSDAPSPSGGGLGWGFKSADYDLFDYNVRDYYDQREPVVT